MYRGGPRLVQICQGSCCSEIDDHLLDEYGFQPPPSHLLKFHQLAAEHLAQSNPRLGLWRGRAVGQAVLQTLLWVSSPSLSLSLSLSLSA